MLPQITASGPGSYDPPSTADRRSPARARVGAWTLVIIGLGGLFAGITGPLLSAFIPALVRDAVGDQRTLIGFIMAIDNVLLLVLVPWSGPASDRASADGRGRRRLVIGGFLLAAVGMALLPGTSGLGIAAVIAVLIVLHSGINLQRAPFHALLADVVPSRQRSLANGSTTFQMCVAAIVFLMLGRALGMTPAFLVAAVTVVATAAAVRFGLRESLASDSTSADVTFRSILLTLRSTVRGAIPGMRPVFIAAFLLQLTFQTFTTWYALHAPERFGMPQEDVTIGFIAWAVGGVVGALPAGFIGSRIGRRNAMLLGFVLMTACLIALDRIDTLAMMIPLLALASASWTMPMVNAYPLFVEPVPSHRRGLLTSLYLLAMAFGGALGDPFNGRLFDASGSYRPMFLLMAAYSALAVVAVLAIPRGAGEADAAFTA